MKIITSRAARFDTDPPVTGRQGVGVSANAVINGFGFAVLIWGGILKAIGLF